MAFQAEQRVVAAHARAVVGHANQAAPARLDFHVMRVASASSEFSTNSLTTLAGRSTTSPAAIWLATCSGNRRMRFMPGSSSRQWQTEAKMAPRPGSLRAEIRPRWSSTIFLQMESPSPVPWALP